MPVSSPRSSGCRATAWIIEPKMLPMPMPAPSEPRPIPRASAIALPASAPSSAAARKKNDESMVRYSSLVLGLDGRADVDGGQGGEDIRLDRDDDHDLEQVEDRRGGHRDYGQQDVLDDEDQPEEREDQHVAREHVRVETHGEADQAHELPEDLEGDDQRVHRLWDVGD